MSSTYKAGWRRVHNGRVQAEGADRQGAVIWLVSGGWGFGSFADQSRSGQLPD